MSLYINRPQKVYRLKDALENLPGIVYDLYYFNYMWVTVWVCAHECTTSQSWRSQVSLELKFRDVVRCLMRVMGIELGTYAKAACPLNRCQLPLQSHLFVLLPGVYCSKSQSFLTWREQTYYRFYPGDSKTCVISPQYTHVTPGVRAQGAFRIRFFWP